MADYAKSNGFSLIRTADTPLQQSIRRTPLLDVSTYCFASDLRPGEAEWDNGDILDTSFEHGLDLINAGSYYAAHEALEDAWRGVHGWTKQFYQGMVQVAISLHHFSTGNLTGAQSVMEKCRRNLSEFPDSFCGVDLRDLDEQLAGWQKAMAVGGPYPPKVIVRFEREQ